MTHYAIVFLAGLAGSFHCIGMCGGFACAISRDPRGRGATVHRHLIYNLGRVTTYCFLGGLVGYLGAHFVHLWDDSALGTAQRALALVSGALMVFIGLQFFGYFKRLHYGAAGFGGQSFIQALRALLKQPSHAAALSLGVLNGFLPCPLVYAFAAQAAASGGPLPGVLVMFAFGLGTFPAMLMMGGLGSRFRRVIPRVDLQGAGGELVQSPSATGTLFNWRLQGVRVAGAFIVLLGLVTLARGMLPFTAHGTLH